MFLDDVGIKLSCQLYDLEQPSRMKEEFTNSSQLTARLSSSKMTVTTWTLLFVTFLNQIFVSLCLPTTTVTAPDKSSPFVTQLGNGEPIVLIPKTTTPSSLNVSSKETSDSASKTFKALTRQTNMRPPTEEATGIANALDATTATTLTKAVSNTANLSPQHGSIKENDGGTSTLGSQVDAPSSLITVYTPDDKSASSRELTRPRSAENSPFSSPSGSGEAESQDQSSSASSTHVNVLDQVQTASDVSALLDNHGPSPLSAATPSINPVVAVPRLDSLGDSESAIRDGSQAASSTKGSKFSGALDSNGPTSTTQDIVAMGPSPTGTQLGLPASAARQSATVTTAVAGLPIIPGPVEPLPSGMGATSQESQGTLPQPKDPVLDGPPSPGFIIPTADSVPDNIPISAYNVPTTTQTAAPPGYSLQVVPDATWKSDTVVTTNVPGIDQLTVVPVFANCNGCDPGGALVVLGAFKPGIAYDLPKLPGLPSVPGFHMPCVLFCGSPGGGKPGPPVRENGGGSNDDGGGKNNENTDDDDNDDDSGDNNDDQDDDQDEDDDNENDDEEDEEDEDEEDDDEQQSTDPATQPSTTAAGSSTASSTATSPSSSSIESSIASSSTGTQAPLITDTIYIDERSTEMQAPDEDMNQYLLAAYSSLGYLEDEDPIPTTLATSATQAPSLIDIFPAPSPVGSLTFARAVWPSSLTPGSYTKTSSPPSSTVSPPVTPSSTTEEASRKTVTPEYFITPKLECNGMVENTWMYRDKAVTAAYEFCKQDETHQEYYEDSVDHVEFSLIENGRYLPRISTHEPCLQTLVDLIDGCDGNDPINPLDHKFGGQYWAKQGWVYEYKPLNAKIPDQSCDVSFKGVFDGFEIRGKWFPGELLGEDGSGLKSELEGCGAVTNWLFEWTPDDVEFEWFASGQLPFGTKNCVGKATMSAGGSGHGNCKGPG
ncbi:MAG: hypothetical protein Q9174_004877 [Haloplaca sp. 1 TL-2023]